MDPAPQPGCSGHPGAPVPCATLRVVCGDAERTEAFADIGQAASWTLVHRGDGSFDTVTCDIHESAAAVRRILGEDGAALARFLVRCGKDDKTIAAELADSGIDTTTILREARDELAAMAEFDED